MQRSAPRILPSSRGAIAAVLWIAGWAHLACSGGDAAKWRRFESAEGGFTVDLPGPPASSTQPSLAVGSPTEVTVLAVDRGPNGIFQISYYTLVDAAAGLAPEPMLRLDCLQSFTESSFVPSEPVSRSIAAHPGLVVSAVAPRSPSLPRGGFTEHRCAIVGQRMLHLVAVGPDTPEFRRDGQRFLDSFTLLR